MFFFSSRRRHTSSLRDWSSDVCSSDLETRALQFGLYEDAARYDSWRVTVTTPALVFQGRKDTLVDPDMVERFVAARPTMTLQMLDDDHQLLASLEFIWKATAVFLRLDP